MTRRRRSPKLQQDIRSSESDRGTQANSESSADNQTKDDEEWGDELIIQYRSEAIRAWVSLFTLFLLPICNLFCCGLCTLQIQNIDLKHKLTKLYQWLHIFE